MDLSDYRDCQNFYEYLSLFTDSCRDSIKLVHEHVKKSTEEQNNQLSQTSSISSISDPSDLITVIDGYLKSQKQALVKEFGEALKRMRDLTTPKVIIEEAIKIYNNDDEEEKKGVGEVSDELKLKREMNRKREAEEAKKQAEIFTQLNLTVADDIKKTAVKIITLLKLGHELKNEYPLILTKILDLEKDQNFFLQYFTDQFKLEFVDDLQPQFILTHSREWISLKLTAVKQLREIDNKLFNTNGQIMNECYNNLNNILYHDPSKVVQEARANFKERQYRQVREMIENYSKPPVNEHSDSIIKKILDYINEQASLAFRRMDQFMCDDGCITVEEGRIIAQQSAFIKGLANELGKYINIVIEQVPKSIDKIINERVFKHLLDSFSSVIEEIDEMLEKLNFQEAMNEVKEFEEVYKIMSQEFGIDIRNMEQFQKIKDLSRAVLDKKLDIEKKIDSEISNFTTVERQIFTFNQTPTPRAISENLEQIRQIPAINQKREKFHLDLSSKYEKLCDDTNDKLKTTEDQEELLKIEKEVEKIRATLQYVPVAVKDTVVTKLDSIIQFNRNQRDVQQERQREVIQTALTSTTDPASLGSLLATNIKYLKEDAKVNIRNRVSQDFDAIIQTANALLEKNEVERLINIEIPKLKAYMKDPNLCFMVSGKSQADYASLKTDMLSKFESAIDELIKYFTMTHNEKGERILNLPVDKEGKVQYPAYETSMKIVREVCTQIAKLKDGVLEESSIIDIESNYRKLIIYATDYLKVMKAQHAEALKDKIVKQTIAAISNIQFTDLILSNKFEENIKRIRGLCEEERKTLEKELSEVKLQTMKEKTVAWLTQLQQEIFSKEFINMQRSQTELEEFFVEIQKSYNTLSAAQQTEDLAIVKDRGTTNITQLALETLRHCEIQVGRIVNQAEEINNKFISGEDIAKEEFDKFGIFYKTLKVMEVKFEIGRNKVESVIKTIETTLSNKLLAIKQASQACYVDKDNLKLGQLAINLAEIQKMKECMSLFEDKIEKRLSDILNDYQKNRSRDPKAVLNLQQELRGLSESYGVTLAKEHPFFKGVNTLLQNQKFQSKSIIDVLKEIRGTEKKDQSGNIVDTDLGEQQKKVLEEYYNDFLVQYTLIVDTNLIVKRDSRGERLPIDLTSIKSMIKNKLSNQGNRKWGYNEVQGFYSFGDDPKSPKPVRMLAFLLANIFALWSLMNSDHYQKQEDMGEKQENLKGYLLQPHVAQILSIFRILGVGYSERHTGSSPTWTKFFGDSAISAMSDIRNNLIQIKTGEGKSVTLAVVSMILALNGFEIKCACYSKYLSERDYESFAAMFKFLELDDLIDYGTFNEVSEMQINREGFVRDIVKSLLLNQDEEVKTGEIKKPSIDRSVDKRPQVLLIDEVDVFFSSDFFGNIYKPQALIQHPLIAKLTDYIWGERQKKLSEISKMSVEEKEAELSNVPYMSLKALKEQQVYKDALLAFKPEYQYLIEEAAKKMVVDVVEFESPQHQYKMVDGLIGYQNQDQISTNATIGYQTLFAYYYRHKLGEVTSEVLNSKKAIGIDCAEFSYAEVPLEYDIILGVTGTLETLSEPQKKIIKNIYNIHNQTLSPSVHISDQQNIFNPNSDVNVVKDSSKFFMQLVNTMNEFLKFNLPVIFFFQNSKKLQEFLNSDNFKGYSCQIFKEEDNNKEKALKVLKATQARTISCATKNFGRGTDFCCDDQEVCKNGGLVVIQAFFSEDLSEETQIRGRTGRQGTKGKYLMVLNIEDLSDFNIEPEDIENSKHIYNTLCSARQTKIEGMQNETTNSRLEKKVKHDKSNEMITHVKDLVSGVKLSKVPFVQEDLIAHLLDLNKGISFETEFKVIKVLVLIDCTGSMSATLQKTKNAVEGMFQGAKEELKKQKLSEDLVVMKVAGYRNYNSLEDGILSAPSNWSSNSNEISEYINTHLISKGGWGNEAIEIGLWYANQEIINNQGLPLSMIIIIGDALANTPDNVTVKRQKIAEDQKDAKYWQKTQNYKEETHYTKELGQIEAAGVPVHAFYVLNDKVQPENHEKAKEKLRTEYSKLAVNEGVCAFLDIHNAVLGQQKLKEFITNLINIRAIQLNKGKEAADAYIKTNQISFT